MNWISDSVLQILSDAAKNEHTSNLFSEKALTSIRQRTTKEDDEVIIGVLQRYLTESKKHEKYSIREQTVDNVRSTYRLYVISILTWCIAVAGCGAC